MRRRRLGVTVMAALLMSGSSLVAQTFPVDDPVLQQIWQEGMEDYQVYGIAQTLIG